MADRSRRGVGLSVARGENPTWDFASLRVEHDCFVGTRVLEEQSASPSESLAAGLQTEGYTL